MTEQRRIAPPPTLMALIRPTTRTGDMLAPLRSFASIRRCNREEEICAREDPADCWYCVLSGAARKSLLRFTGQRQIVDFLFPGDFFGFTNQNRHRFAVHAIAPGTTIARFPWAQVDQLVEEHPAIGREIRTRAFEAIARLEQQILILERTTALEKVGSFLLQMRKRLPSQWPNVTMLPMSRYDIADCLGMSVETVSRALAEMKHLGSISMIGPRQVMIPDPSAIDEEEDEREGEDNF